MMAIILTIDTAVEVAGVCLSVDRKIISIKTNDQLKDHAGWLQPAIEDLMKRAGLKLAEIDAVGVTAGPGSYTGLRVGLASAKGLCFALSKPLICLNTLQVMAFAAIRHTKNAEFYCPMIDARRMEVFTSIYNDKLDELMPPTAMVPEGPEFDQFLATGRVIFFGNGAPKFKDMLKKDNAIFAEIPVSVADVADLTADYYEKRAFFDLKFTEPLYIKAFYSPVKAN
jgi:tRNA threonylcarbamoyladenosine biosynthesis protein TsaB